ncbi:hypothetical protein VP01_3747g1 [Puccinia sorghi]|uniref:Uncharacterized protein n=1 Tax=Puccinia sorghi TaxID=27349 RepID=A0A0L6UU06_9BASI|nr:hypothetical protein VP01_3747g1 [Puccinia sorghi]
MKQASKTPPLYSKPHSPLNLPISPESSLLDMVASLSISSTTILQKNKKMFPLILKPNQKSPLYIPRRRERRLPRSHLHALKKTNLAQDLDKENAKPKCKPQMRDPDFDDFKNFFSLFQGGWIHYYLLVVFQPDNKPPSTYKCLW